MARILIHSLVFPPDANSNAYVLADLGRELQSLGHEIIVLTTTPHYNPPVDTMQQPLNPIRGRWLLQSNLDGMKCYHVRVAPKKGSMMKRLLAASRFHLLGLYVALGNALRCDIVLSQPPPITVGLVGALIAKRHKAKAVYIAQDLFPDNPIRQRKITNPILIRMLRVIERRVYASNHAVTSICKGMTETLRSRVGPETVLTTIPNFVRTDLYRPLPRDNEFARTHGLHERFVISYVGNLGNAQDFSPVLAAAKACADLNILFLLIGGGIKTETLCAEIAKLPLSNVQVWDYQARDVTPWINASTDICLVLLAPHVQNGSFPSKIYTLMASGRPILLYGHTESDAALFVRDANVGRVVGNGDIKGFVETIRHFYHHRDELVRYGANGVTLIREQYSAGAVAAQYHALIGQLLSGVQT